MTVHDMVLKDGRPVDPLSLRDRTSNIAPDYRYVIERQDGVLMNVVRPKQQTILPSGISANLKDRYMRKKSLLCIMLFLLSCVGITAEDIYIVNDNSVRIRDTPSLNGKILNTVNAGVQVKLLQKGEYENINSVEARWFRVHLLDNKSTVLTGWIFSYYLSSYLSFVNSRDIIIKNKDNALFHLGQDMEDVDILLKDSNFCVITLPNKYSETDLVKQYQINKDGIVMSFGYDDKKLSTIVITSKKFEMVNGLRIGMPLDEIHKYIQTSNLGGSFFIWLNGPETTLSFDINDDNEVSRIILTSEM